MKSHQKYLLSIALIFAVFGVASKPAPAEAKMMSLAFFNIFRLADFSGNDNSLSETEQQKIDEIEKIESERQDKIERINKYFEKRNMPLAGYGKDFVDAAEKCDLDWRLLPAIGVRESSGGKFEFNNNPFGWGSAKIKFKSFSDAIYNVGEHLCGLRETTARYYKDKTVYQKLWYYNGTVIASYPDEVIEIMDMF